MTLHNFNSLSLCQAFMYYRHKILILQSLWTALGHFWMVIRTVLLVDI